MYTSIAYVAGTTHHTFYKDVMSRRLIESIFLCVVVMLTFLVRTTSRPVITYLFNQIGYCVIYQLDIKIVRRSFFFGQFTFDIEIVRGWRSENVVLLSYRAKA